MSKLMEAMLKRKIEELYRYPGNFTTDEAKELIAECERHKVNHKPDKNVQRWQAECVQLLLEGKLERPKIVHGVDFGPIIDIAENYLDFVEGDEYHEDNDYRYYIFETVMKTLYGDRVFKYTSYKGSKARRENERA